MATDLCMALGLDKEDLPGKVITIAENSGSNANFVISALMCYCIENKTPICLLAAHNTFGHYHNVCMKLGGNLRKFKDEGFVMCIDVMKETETYINNASESHEENYMLDKNKEELMLKDVFLKLKRDAEKLLDVHHKHPCIFLDDVSDFIILGCSVTLVLGFFQYCRSFVLEKKGCSLIALCHAGEDDVDSLKVITGMSYSCNVKVVVSGLHTGSSGDVSGMLKVESKLSDGSLNRRKKLYHYKLEERKIVVFSPGTSPAFI